MLKTLKRDWWKLLLIVLVCAGLGMLTGETMMRIYVQNVLDKLSEIQMYIVSVILILLLGFLSAFLNQILPACIHEQKNLWNITWKYLVLALLCNVLLGMMPFILPDVKILFTIFMLVSSIIFHTLFLGFLCAVSKNTGLLVGIKNLFTKYLLKYICIILILVALSKIISAFISIDLINSVLSAIIQIAIVYVCIPLFKKQAK